MKFGEFEFIDHIRQLECSAAACSPEVVGIGDDCAVIPQHSGFRTIVSTDMLVEGSHFLRERISAYQLGWKSAAVNFSDIAAMGGLPEASFLSLALPSDLSDGWMEDFMRGYSDISARYGFPLLGGDTTSAKDGISICVTVLGRKAEGENDLLRSGAQPGDLICVSGLLGDSALGLDSILNSRSDVPASLLKAHLEPCPEMEFGRVAATTKGVHSMMDISDGVASDLRHILDASVCSAEIDCESIPISDDALAYCRTHGLCALRAALCGGEDYKLLFTASPDALEAASGSVKLGGNECFVIGKILEKQPVQIKWLNLPSEIDENSLIGFRHF